MQTYSGKVMAFSEEEVGVYQGARSTPTSPLKRLTSQLSKVRDQSLTSHSHTTHRLVCIQILLFFLSLWSPWQLPPSTLGTYHPPPCNSLHAVPEPCNSKAAGGLGTGHSIAVWQTTRMHCLLLLMSCPGHSWHACCACILAAIASCCLLRNIINVDIGQAATPVNI